MATGASEVAAAGAASPAVRVPVPLLVATVVETAAAGAVFPLLAELQDRHGLPTWGLGLISAVSFLVGLVAQLGLSRWADRGHARALLVGGLVLAALSCAWFAVATELWAFVAARALSGLGLGCFQPAARATVARLDPPNAGRHLGRLAAMELAGFTAATPAVGWLGGEVALGAPFALLAGAAAVTAAWLVRVPLPTRPGPAGAVAPGSSGSLRSLVRTPGVLAAALLAVALFVPVGAYDALWARYLTDLGAGPTFVGISLALYGVPFVVLASHGGRLADRWGPRRSAVIGVVVGVAPLTALYGQLRVPGLLLVVAVVEAAFQAVALPGAQAAMAQACPPDRLAAGQGLAGALSLAAAGLTALVAAPVYGAAGAGALFGGAAVVMALLALLAASLGRRSP